MTTVVFPAWARLALGLLIAFLGYLVSGDVIRIGEDERALIAGVTALFATAGVVPPTPETIPPLNPSLRFVLLIAVVVLTYLLQAVFDIDAVLRGILQAALLLAASVGIVPPQAGARSQHVVRGGSNAP